MAKLPPKYKRKKLWESNLREELTRWHTLNSGHAGRGGCCPFQGPWLTSIALLLLLFPRAHQSLITTKELDCRLLKGRCVCIHQARGCVGYAVRCLRSSLEGNHSTASLSLYKCIRVCVCVYLRAHARSSQCGRAGRFVVCDPVLICPFCLHTYIRIYRVVFIYYLNTMKERKARMIPVHSRSSQQQHQ